MTHLTFTPLYLFDEILRKCNTSDLISSSKTSGIYHPPTVVLYSGDWHKAKQLPIGWIGNQFLTCYSQRFLTFKFYLTPCQPELWTYLITCLVLVVTCLTCYTKYGDSGNTSSVGNNIATTAYKSFSPWFLVLSTVLPPRIWYLGYGGNSVHKFIQ